MYRYTKLAFALIVGVVSILAAVFAQAQVQGTVAPGQVQGTSVAPPLFQGIIVDAKGKTVGRIYINAYGPTTVHMVIRQIDGIWVGLPVFDFTSGFAATDPTAFLVLYQSVDCTGQAYALLNQDFHVAGAPARALVATIPPSTAPYIYFGGTPAFITINSQRAGPLGTCTTVPPRSGWAGPIQSVPVSSLGLTLPFSVK
jgi:hypothetical protein